MAQSKRQIEAVLATAGSRPRHRFGQNFMIDANLVRAIADAGEIQPGDVVLEVGPGTGTLTEELLERVGPGGRVVAVEIDRDLAAALGRRLAEEVSQGRLQVIEGDAMNGKHGLNPALLKAIGAPAAPDADSSQAPASAATSSAAGRVRLVANLPYNIASPLVVELLLAGVELLAFTVQKEVADRLRAGPEQGKAYGPLSVVVQTLAQVEALRSIPPAAFWPRPKIDSSLVRLRRLPPDPLVGGRERDFGRFVSAIFSQRRKTLRNALSREASDVAGPLAAAGLSGDERPEQAPPAAFRRLYHATAARAGDDRAE